jgi:NAD(P)-dependent dehydrogenase (short-subunit alcohol dehydrogenase family)
VRRAADAFRAPSLKPMMLDIMQEATIAALVQRIAEDSEQRPLRALVTNAGLQVNAPVETLPLAEWRRLFDVNPFGHAAMIQVDIEAVEARTCATSGVVSGGLLEKDAGMGIQQRQPY